MSYPVIITIVAVLLLLLFLFDQTLGVLKNERMRGAVRNNWYLRLLDRIFNDFFEWHLWARYFRRSLLVLAGVALVVYAFICMALPFTPPLPEVTIDRTDSTLLQRGEYLVNHVAICTDCHSQRDISRYSWPAIDTLIGAGGPFLSRKAGFEFPGEAFTPNITPFAIGGWSDAELLRTITTGVKPDGSTLYHAMPFTFFSKADPDDLKAIVAYVRSLAPVAQGPVGKTTIDHLPTLRSKMIPRGVEPTYLKDLRTAVDSGRYLVQLAICTDCHTPNKWADFKDESRYLSGGLEFPMPTGGYVYSANLTPDETGLMHWSEQAFVDRFKYFRDSTALHKVEPNTVSSLMPWFAYAHMTDQDLRSIYAYLRTIQPIHNPVTKFSVYTLKGDR